jgi:hypothetical protein
MKINEHTNEQMKELKDFFEKTLDKGVASFSILQPLVEHINKESKILSDALLELSDLAIHKIELSKKQQYELILTITSSLLQMGAFLDWCKDFQEEMLNKHKSARLLIWQLNNQLPNLSTHGLQHAVLVLSEYLNAPSDEELIKEIQKFKEGIINESK